MFETETLPGCSYQDNYSHKTTTTAKQPFYGK